MWKFALKFGFIIVANLFAFLILWNILDALFETERVFLMACLVLSVLSVMLIWSFYVRKTLKQLEDLKNEVKEEKALDNK